MSNSSSNYYSSTNQDDDDPYRVLGVRRDASKQEIRAAYRKLALRHHPDKQTTPQAKQQAHETFSKISHAYEQLSSDNNYRQEQEQYAPSSSARDFYPFHDPFEVFASVFGNEFGGASRNTGAAAAANDPFGSDPFFADPLFGGGRSSMFGGRGSVFGGSMFGEDMFSQMHRQHMDMMRQHQAQDNERASGMPSGSSYYYSSSSTSSTNNYGGNNNAGESVTTTTRMINGKRQTVIERTVRKADGSVERHVETSGDDGFPEAHRIPLVEPPAERQQLPSSNQDYSSGGKHEAEETNEEGAAMAAAGETQPSPWKKMRRRLTGHKDDKK